uniref:MADF domain-containing protein n=1 Tax=Strigamia maritima TaxID=126957 RepID=T1JIC0_STRMM
MSSLKEKEFRERLISQVNQRNALWNKKSPEYRDKSLKDEGWNDIARILEVPAKECKIRWKNLLDTFRPLIRASKKMLNGDSLEGIPEKRKVVKWPYFNQMLFLKDVLSKGEPDVRDQFTPEDILELNMGTDQDSNDKGQSDVKKVDNKLTRPPRKRKSIGDDYFDEIQEKLNLATKAIARKESPVASFTDYLGDLLLKVPESKRRKCERDLIERVNVYIDGLEDINDEL